MMPKLSTSVRKYDNASRRALRGPGKAHENGALSGRAALRARRDHGAPARALRAAAFSATRLFVSEGAPRPEARLGASHFRHSTYEVRPA